MSLPLLPIWIVDLLGSALMILFSFVCVRLARRLRGQDQNNVVWTYLLWVCYGLAGFAVSRSVGHIAKRILLTAGHDEVWEFLQPYSGAINSLMFTVVAAVTLFFERIWWIYQQILADKQALQLAHQNLLFLNRNLEDLVAERTRDLSASERKYRRIFEASQDMILVVAPTGAILDINAAGRKMLAIEEHQAVIEAMVLQDFLQDAAEWAVLQETFREQGFVANGEASMKRRDGTYFDALLSATATLEETSGEMDMIHFLVKDVSQRKAMQRQLLQADKLASIGQLASGIAHEINNPLGMILGYTQLLIRTEPEGTQRHEDLRTIEKHARTCKTIVGDMLSFARSTQTRKELSRLHSVIDEVVNVLQHHFAQDQVAIEKHYDDHVPLLVLDKEKIKQVLMNLLMNAKHAIGKSGAIRLTTHYAPKAQQVLLEVVDSGCGIEPQHLSRIFDPFFTTKATGEGTGLGLSVSYGIVRDHDGDIMVTSEPGKGSIFTVILPVPSNDAEPLI
jgi:two-component system, NtrC family, sensor kinase